MSDLTDLAAMWALGWRKLNELRSETGYNASESGTGLYAALFGRDSLWILLFLLDIAASRPAPSPLRTRVHDDGMRILTGLADRQGQRVLDLVEEQPGKIPHESWLTTPWPAEVHALPMINNTSWCGFDQTFLFVTAVRRFLDLFPTTPIRDRLLDAAGLAIYWIETFALDTDRGLYAHRSHPPNLIHQVWKDSFDAITHAGFDVPPEPVAWIDVQGYAFRALLDGSDLLRATGSTNSSSERLTVEAERLRQRVNELFWFDDEGTYAVAVDGELRPVLMVTSNPGHALWSGLPDPDRAASIADRLTRADLLTQYGLRTLSAIDRFFVPHGYHRGTIWPFDNAVAAKGLLAYGHTEGAGQIMERVVGALARLGSTFELYVVIEADTLVEPPASLIANDPQQLLLTRQHPPVNSNQGFTCAGLLACVSDLAARDGAKLGAEGIDGSIPEG